MKSEPKSKQGVSFRPKKDHADRLAALIEATEHDKTFFLDKVLEMGLPELEKRFARELKELRSRRASDRTTVESDPALEETSSSSPSSENLRTHLEKGVAAGKLYATRQGSKPQTGKRKSAPRVVSPREKDQTTAE